MPQKKIIIRIADTDVVVLAISVVEEIKVEELWVAFGTGKHFRYTAAHAIASGLGADKSRALSAFHAVTCCDKVSFFGGKGKLKAWNTWTAFPTVTSAFFELGTEKANLSQDACDKIEQFVVFMYEKNRAVTTVNAARQKLFSQRCKAINTYIHRAPRLSSPSAWGWTKDEGQPRKPLWTTLRQAEDSYYELIHCELQTRP